MTQWIENPEGGRARGPRAIARAWIEVLIAPRRFFRAAVAPADQAPGLFFVIAVVVLAEGSRYLLVPSSIEWVAGGSVAAAVLWLSVTAILIAPLALHLLVALQTVLLMAFVPERAGISETVQVMAYATAPCVFAGVPVPAVRVACAIYGTILLAIGIAVVHDAPYRRVVPAVAIPASIGFGYGFRGFGAARRLLDWGAKYVGDVGGLLYF